MPTKTLPSSPSLDHLKYQAKDLLIARQAQDLEACQRIREFHPRFKTSTDEAIAQAKFSLADAQLALAREYGFPSWARLKAYVEGDGRPDLTLPHHERIEDPVFRQAVDLLDSGDAEGLRAHLHQHPAVVRQRVVFDGGNYFGNPTLLEFVAENPIRHETLPANIVEVAKVILDEGGRESRSSVDMALALVCSGRVPRECDVQIPLIDLLCDYGADPNAGMGAAIGHGEFAAVEALIRRGAHIDLPVAAGTGRIEEVRRLIPTADAEQRHRALALSSLHGHTEIVRLLLDAGEDPNRYNPRGIHSHSVPLHQAVWYGHEPVVRLLVERGARLDIEDILFHGTPIDWAEYGGRHDLAAYLRGLARPSGPG
jgi:ankyrin repeat protein